MVSPDCLSLSAARFEFGFAASACTLCYQSQRSMGRGLAVLACSNLPIQMFTFACQDDARQGGGDEFNVHLTGPSLDDPGCQEEVEVTVKDKVRGCPVLDLDHLVLAGCAMRCVRWWPHSRYVRLFILGRATAPIVLCTRQSGAVSILSRCAMSVNGICDGVCCELTRCRRSHGPVGTCAQKNDHIVGSPFLVKVAVRLQGRSVQMFGTSGSGVGELQRPAGIACLGGKVYVSDLRNDRIQVGEC